MPFKDRENSWNGDERRAKVHISDTQLDGIAERAAEKAVTKVLGEFYRGVGKGIINKLLMLIGAAVVAALLWAKDRGWTGQ
jgi:hypothetical protein